MVLFPQSLTFITCLSKCRIGDVFKHSFFYFPYLFRMYEEGGGQMTCNWYVLISFKLFLIVFFFRGNNSLYSAYFEVHFHNQIIRWYRTLHSVNFVSNHWRTIYWQICWNDLKLSHGIYHFTHNLGKNFYFAQCLGIWGISWN